MPYAHLRRILAVCALTLTLNHAAFAQLVFTDVTATAGVALPGDLTESVAWGDYDNDGDQDLYLTVNGANRLFRNDGGDNFTDVTAVAGVGNALFSVGCAFGDLDNDGDLDLYVVNFGAGRDALYRNDGPVGAGGEYAFTDVAAAAGINIELSSRGMALLDYNSDGLLDVYVVAIGEYILYRNDGNLQFTDVAALHGVNQSATGVGVTGSDVDNNGWIDIFTGNRSNDPNLLYMNDGGFFFSTPAIGIDAVGAGMGVLSFDYDNDLDFDLYWTTWPQPAGTINALYRNDGEDIFTDVAVATGTDDPLGWGISCNAGDVDNDGWEDFFVTNGFSPMTTPNVLFRNLGGTFTDATAALGGAAVDGRGVAFADYDRDGDLDLMLTTDGDVDNRLWRNDTINSNHWVVLNLVGTSSNRSAIGARIEVTTPLGTVVKEVSGGAGRGSQNSLPVEFGLGAAAGIDQITIRWPNRTTQFVHAAQLGVDRYITVIEGQTIPAVSQWGLAMMTLLVATAGTIVLIRRQRRERLHPSPSAPPSRGLYSATSPNVAEDWQDSPGEMDPRTLQLG